MRLNCIFSQDTKYCSLELESCQTNVAVYQDVCSIALVFKCGFHMKEDFLSKCSNTTHTRLEDSRSPSAQVIKSTSLVQSSHAFRTVWFAAHLSSKSKCIQFTLRDEYKITTAFTRHSAIYRTVRIGFNFSCAGTPIQPSW